MRHAPYALRCLAVPARPALRYARKLGETGKHDATSQLLVFEVALRRGKLLQALRSLRRAAAAAPASSPDVFSAKVRFLVSAQGDAGSAVTEAVRAVLAEELAAPDMLPDGQTVAQVVAAFAEANKLSLPHRTAAAEMLVSPRRWRLGSWRRTGRYPHTHLRRPPPASCRGHWRAGVCRRELVGTRHRAAERHDRQRRDAPGVRGSQRRAGEAGSRRRGRGPHGQVPGAVPVGHSLWCR